MSADDELNACNAGARGGAPEQMAAYQPGLQARQAGGGGGGGGGGRLRASTGLLEQLSVIHLLLVLAAMAGARFASRRLGARLGGAGSFFGRFRLRRKPS